MNDRIFLQRGGLRAVALLIGCLALGSPQAQTPQYPQRPLRLVVPFAAGGAIDAMARPVAQALGRELGQPVVVENKPGAAGNLGAAQVAKALADGYTLLVGTSATHGANPSLFANLQYDAIADFEPISLWGNVPNVLVVHAERGVRSVSELIEVARREPGRLTYGSAGVGTSLHLAGVMFEKAAQVRLTHVPYKGGALASMDLLGGVIDMTFDTISVALPNVRAGKLRALAVAAPARHFALPDVPTFAELGLSGVNAGTWAGVFAPRGTPATALRELDAAFVRVLAQQPVQEALHANGVQVQALRSEGVRTFVIGEIERWGQLAREAKLTPQ